MDRDRALAFLAAHQPLPADEELTEADAQRFHEVTRYFAAEPDEACLPLLLGAFGNGTGHGVYPRCDDVFAHFDTNVLAPHLARALTSAHRGVRWWAAHWAADHPHATLEGPLLRLLDRPEDDDAHPFALAALGGLLHEGAVGLRPLLEARRAQETDPERRELLTDILSSGPR